MIHAKLAIASALVLAAVPASTQSVASPNDKPVSAVPAPKYEKQPAVQTNPADEPASTGTQGGDMGVSGGKDIPAAGTGAEAGPGR